MKFNVGDRVTSSEVPENIYGNIYQDKLLEIVEFLDNGKVECKYFLEKEICPEIVHYVVNEDSLTFISKIPLNYKGHEKDIFFDKHYKKRKL